MTVTKETSTSTTRTAPPAPRRAGEPPRRPMPAGHVIVVLSIGLLVGSLLNARGMLKTAQSLNLDSTRRELSLIFAKPLYRAAHFLHTDRPRLWIQDFIGREHDDDIATVAGPSPTTTTTTAPLPPPTTASPGVTAPPPPPPPTTAAPPRQVFDANHRLRVYIAGDSLAVVPGQEYLNLVTGVRAIDVPNGIDTKISSGLSRPDYFDWPARILGEVKSIQPNAVILTFGANDDQAVQSPDGNKHGFGSPGWITEYRRRVGGLMDAIVSQGRTVLWTGIPVVRDPARWAHYQLIDEIYASEAAARPGKVFFVDTTAIVAGPRGEYEDYLPDSSGQTRRVRSADGIHVERPGGRLIADAVLAKMHAIWDLRG
jgi:hypothetical protein